jgi:hypothetical protein
MYLSLNTFQYFPHLLTKLSNFCVIGWGNWRVTNVLVALEVHEQLRKHRKRMSDSLLQFFWKTISRPLSSSSPIFFSFLIRFEWFKTWLVHQLEFHKTSFYSRGKDATIKDFKLEILIYFNSLISNNESLYTKHPISSPFLYQIKQFLWNFKKAKLCLL